MNEQKNLGNDGKNSAQTKKKSFGNAVKSAFLTGLFVVLPVSLTAYIVVFLINTMAAPARGSLTALLDFFNIEPQQNVEIFDVGVTIVAAAIVAIFLAIIGLLSRYFFGKWFFNLIDKILLQVPIANSVYSAVKQIVDTFGSRDEQTFSKVVFVEFPRKNSWTLGFLTSEEKTKFDEISGMKLLHIFVPTTPNPTGGYMILVPENEVKFLEISVADPMKLIVSGGAVVPEMMKIEKKS